MSAIDAIPLTETNPERKVSPVRLLELFVISGAHFSFDYRDFFAASHLQLRTQICECLPGCIRSLHANSVSELALEKMKTFVFLLLAGIPSHFYKLNSCCFSVHVIYNGVSNKHILEICAFLKSLDKII